MELFMFHHQEWQSVYNNCSNIDITPIEWDHRRHLPDAFLLMALSTIYYALYLPCIYSFWRNLRDERGHPNPCYQIMFYISVVDMGILWILSYWVSSQFLSGNTYCTHPYANYILGTMALSLVMSEAIADVVLALNRCVDILSPEIAKFLFTGKRIWFWLGPTTIYGLYSFIFNKPIVFNGFTIAFSNNPYLGIWDDGGLIFHNPLQLDFNEFVLFFGTPIIYGLFLLGLAIKTNAFKSTGGVRISKIQRAAFYQVFMISIFNMVAGSLYYIKEQFPAVISPLFIFIAHFAWMHIHGIPPVIYLLFNKTIRSDIRMLYMKIFKPHRVGHVHGVTILVHSQNLCNSQQIFSKPPTVIIPTTTSN